MCSDHGYIAGEHFTCPVCGHPAEVYSRITGYYRPVQNWNDGKLQEYKNRTVYQPETSVLKKDGLQPEKTGKEQANMEETTEASVEGSTKYLFTTSACPNCKIAKQMLEGEEYEVIDAEAHPDMAARFGILQAPTLVVLDGDEMKKYVNASNIQKFVEHLSQ